jgi:DNA-binding response OmpR family regulator
MDDKLRVLIVEDQNLVSVLMEIVVEDTVPADVFIYDTLASAEKAVDRDFDLALLDVNLGAGTSYGIARSLRKRNIPFVFVSGGSPEELPDELIDTPFIRKPFRDEQIREFVLDAQQKKCAHHH